MQQRTTLYNVLFPLWMLFIIPTVWLAILPANLLIDSLVLFLAFRIIKAENRQQLYKKSIWKVWGFGFLSDIIGSIFLLLTQLILPDSVGDTGFWRWYADEIVGPVAYNPFASVPAFCIVLAAVALSGYMIYLFNSKISLKKTDLSLADKKKTALLLAVLTAPYTFFVPAHWLYNTL